MPPRRGARSPRGPRLFGLAGLVVIGLAFGSGFLAGLHRGGLSSLGLATAVPKTAEGEEPEARGRGGTAEGRPSDHGGRPPVPTPRLTFYQELTKPLPAPPAAPRPDRAPRSERAESRAEPPAAASPSTEGARDRAFTVQVAAYRVRAQAAALRESLLAAGHAAYVVEAETADGVTYRVRVGEYATREAARAVAQAISAERQLQPYVTAR